jgi:hypothetical protein
MNLRKKNKKLKRQLEWAESQLGHYKALCETRPKTTTEHVPTRTLKSRCILTEYELDRPGFVEYVKEELVHKMSRELAAAICVEHQRDHAGVIPRTII